MRFVAVDVETANPNLASICQIGVVTFESGRVVETWSTLVDPEEDFHWGNVGVHGIRAGDVAGAPTFPQVAARLGGLLGGQVVAHHSPFDRNALNKVAARYGLPPVECRWVDTARGARSTWPEFGTGGYGLANLARVFGIAFEHHAAHEDARAAGEVLLRALGHTGLTLPDWLERHGAPAAKAQGDRARNAAPRP